MRLHLPATLSRFAPRRSERGRRRTGLVASAIALGVVVAVTTAAPVGSVERPTSRQLSDIRMQASEALVAHTLSDLPDPAAVMSSTGPIAYGTNTAHEGRWLNVPAVRRADGTTQVIDALPTVHSWSVVGFVWAPSVWHVVDEAAGIDHWVMYVTTHHLESGRQCVGVATSSDPFSAFTPIGDEPLVCQYDLGGTIDASPYVAPDGSLHLLYKNDGNCCGMSTTVFSHQLDPSGTELVGEPTSLLTGKWNWEGGLIEGPSMLVTDDEMFLFYSANKWDSDSYAIGMATCDGPTGPCERVGSGPWMASVGDMAGPGGQEFLRTRSGAPVMVFHAWTPGEVGYDGGGARQMHVHRLEFEDGVPLAPTAA